MKILLAGPGTGKTRGIKKLVEDYDLEKVLILSFTNATVNDLVNSFRDDGINISEKRCTTLHKYALRINHQPKLHILNGDKEYKILKRYADSLDIDLRTICKYLNAITFDDMITSSADFVKTNPTLAKEKIGDIDLLVVDEFQDFNEADRNLIYNIVAYAKEQVILGDDDQCVYGFRNASPDGIIELYNKDSTVQFPHENICFRCPDDVVEACGNLISCNKRRIDKEWKKSGASGQIAFNQFCTQEETVKYLLDKIERIRSEYPESSIMILAPVKFVVAQILKNLNDRGIKFRDLTKKSGLDQKTFEKIWILRAIFGPHKLLNILLLAGAALKKRNVKKDQLVRLLKERFSSEFEPESLVRDIIKIGVVAKNTGQQTLNSKSFNLEDFFQHNPDFNDFYSYLKIENTREENLEKLDRLVAEAKQEFNRVGINVLSIHKSKGLQADYVFIPGLVEGILPRRQLGQESVESQRRLLFVGMTRCRKGLELISTVEWEGRYVYKVDKSQFGYKGKNRTGKTSTFANEMKIHS